MSSTAVMASIGASAAAINAANVANKNAARREKCETAVESYDAQVATGAETREYERCVEMLNPQSADAAGEAGLVVVVALFAVVVVTAVTNLLR